MKKAEATAPSCRTAQPRSGLDEEKARALVAQVERRDYNPPRRERILEWMQQQGFPICPAPDNPDICNVYKDLKFPQEIYENISLSGRCRERRGRVNLRRGAPGR